MNTIPKCGDVASVFWREPRQLRIDLEVGNVDYILAAGNQKLNFVRVEKLERLFWYHGFQTLRECAGLGLGPHV